MDPLSIASGAAGLAISCATIVKTLYTWIDDTVDVDENVSNLLEEVTILSRVLDSVSNASGRVPQAIVAEIDPGNALWGSISATLDDIQNTFDKLKQLMAELEKTNRFSRGFLRKPTKQIKFSLRSKDITIYKDRIKSYNTAMTSAFQMLNINSSQDSVFKVLSGLKSQLRNVEVALHTSSSASPGPSGGREEDDRATQNLRQFVQVAENFHSSASTILREGPRSTVWGGSIMGDPLTEAQTSQIERWIPPPVNEEPHSPLDADSDSETEFARRFEELAIKNEADGDHAKAEQFYRGAIEHGESSSRPVIDITAMKIRLAYACMRQEKWTEADEIITPIAFERKTNDILVYHGMHALALAYVDDSKLDEAERYCKRALWGKRKVLGKDNLSCWETLTLLVFICKARNRIAEAEVHRSFIPNYETIAIDPEALTYLDRSVGALTRPCNISDMVQQTQQPLAFQQEYPPSQPYTTAASGLVLSAGKFQYPKTFGSQYTSPPTPNSHQGVVQYPTQHRQTRSNEESSSNPTIPRKAIGHPDPILSTMHRPQNIGQYSQQQQPEQPRRSTNLSYSHNNDLSGFGLLYDFDSHWYDHIRVGLRAMGWTDDLIKANQQTFIDYFKFRPVSDRTASMALSLPPPPQSSRAHPQPTQEANIYEKQGYLSPPPLSHYSTGPVTTPEPRCHIFVAIDFMNIECASTSVAYVVSDLKNPISELLTEWPGTGSYSRSSIPTVIYYDQYNKVVGWGHDTANALGPTGDPKPGVQKVEGLPLLLIQETEKHIPLPGIPPGLNAVDVSADFLYEVRRAIRTQLQQRLGSKFLDNEQTIHWIITSSEIWANRNKMLWKRALQRAGYLRDENDTRLSFIGEAEASINHAILRYSLSQETKGYFIFTSFGKKEAHVFVCTLPLAPFHFVYRLVSNENQGPSLIAQRFTEVVRTKIKGMRLPDGSRIARKVYAKCIDDFENRILSDFRNNGQEWDVDVAIETEFPDLRIKDGFMTYTNGEILSCFQPFLDRITTIMAHAVGGVLKAGNVLEGIVLAGEFCTSEYLLREIKSKLPDNLRNKVYPPMEPATQVVLGAAHLELTRYLSSGRGV
ncbi:hypothetical protein FPRO05_08350 [Fusarium proliferatum]|uniref:Azaphilone pigments biosynthesis cluster protein L N-terminal domain-containing protein n=1 Tax=Gibberella intermedia TaxID=948311 RepID=A0A365NJF3_GIBIN|nr:hypothetical protein FPRO05_08350 [Fusarium proliferatum]